MTLSVDSGILSKADTSLSLGPPSLTCLAAPMKEEGAPLAADGEDGFSRLILFLATVLRRY